MWPKRRLGHGWVQGPGGPPPAPVFLLPPTDVGQSRPLYTPSLALRGQGRAQAIQVIAVSRADGGGLCGVRFGQSKCSDRSLRIATDFTTRGRKTGGHGEIGRH